MLEKLRSGLIVLMCLFIFTACSDEVEEDDIRYNFGITSASTTDSEEINTLKRAYSDAYELYGLTNNSQQFAPGISKEQILQACEEAEDAINSSSYKFKGRYVYEVRLGQTPIYSKTWGIRIYE